jgi:hypothetical protein
MNNYELILLPSNKKNFILDDILKCYNADRDFIFNKIVLADITDVNYAKKVIEGMWKPQYLYIIDKNKKPINKDDWHINIKDFEVYQNHKTTIKELNNDFNNCYLIVATNNPELKNIPLINKEFIENYVNLQGNIKDIDLTFRPNPDCEFCDGDGYKFFIDQGEPDEDSKCNCRKLYVIIKDEDFNNKPIVKNNLLENMEELNFNFKNRLNKLFYNKQFLFNVCLSYRHDFGLLDNKEKNTIEFECKEIMRAILNNIY